MAKAADVAAYILKNCGDASGLTAWKLQKLVYYSQAWSLVWDDAPMFKEHIEAWANGPVVPDLYNLHKGLFKVTRLREGAASNLTKTQKETVDAVLKYYGKKSAQYLSELTHQEMPWKHARKGLAVGERGNAVISLGDMAEYYGGL